MKTMLESIWVFNLLVGLFWKVWHDLMQFELN